MLDAPKIDAPDKEPTNDHKTSSELQGAEAHSPSQEEKLSKLIRLADETEYNRHVNLRLISEPHDNDCNFWFGFMKTGPIPPHSLLQERSVAETFRDAANMGVRENTAFLTSEIRGGAAFYLYLYPIEGMIMETKQWAQTLAQRFNSWPLAKVGLYIAPELFSEESAATITETLISELVCQSQVESLFLLINSYGINHLINIALGLKRELATKDIGLCVLH